MALINFFNITVCVEIVAFMAALFFLHNKAASYWRLFILYLALTILTEFFGFYFHFRLEKPNYPLYNFLMIVQAAFFSFMFYKFHSSKKLGLWILIVFAAFLLFFIAEGIYNSFTAYHRYSRLFLSVMVVLFSCTFYFAMLKNDSLKTPLKYPPFWITTGLFFFYFGTAAMFAFYDKVSQIKLSGTISFYDLVMGSLNCIFYGSWIFGFICMKKQIQSSKL
jgi:hypothetical protein